MTPKSPNSTVYWCASCQNSDCSSTLMPRRPVHQRPGGPRPAPRHRSITGTGAVHRRARARTPSISPATATSACPPLMHGYCLTLTFGGALMDEGKRRGVLEVPARLPSHTLSQTLRQKSGEGRPINTGGFPLSN
uniref:Uncharacterized protein n=1 Tax=Branchiostoma floridae TaxID=7739 RepID=C3YA78_BRAFL|eukprot:XP_002606616.1 hypothetical protein BRAFLDRAFT_72636 [Branchiostoma floridae]